MSITTTKKFSIVAQKYNCLSDINCKSNIKLNQNGYINNYFYSKILYHSSFQGKVYNNNLYNCSINNNQIVFQRGYIKLNKLINLTHQFHISLQCKKTDWTINQTLLTNVNNNSGFRLILNEVGYEDKCLFQIYTNNGKVSLVSQLNILEQNFNKFEIDFKYNTMYLYLNGKLMDYNENIGYIINSNQYLRIGCYFQGINYANTMEGILKNIIISTEDIVTTSAVTNIVYSIFIKNVDIQWTDPQDNNWYSTTIVRKLGSIPINIEDGTIILTETTKNSYNSIPYTDTLPSDASNEQKYYYRLFTKSIDGVINSNTNIFYVTRTFVTTNTVSHIAYNISVLNVSINWIDPMDLNWEKTVLVRKIGSVPTSQNDGVIILNSTIRNKYRQIPYVDILPQDANFTDKYYYRLFAVSVDNVANKSVDDSFYVQRIALRTGTISNLNYVSNISSVDISWTDPIDNNWKNTMLVRKLGSIPINIQDGTIVLTQTTKNSYNDTPYTDILPNEASEDNIYYYRFFTISIDNMLNLQNDYFQLS